MATPTSPRMVHILNGRQLYDVQRANAAKDFNMGPDDLVPSDVSLVGVHFQMVKRTTNTPFGKCASYTLLWQLAAIAVAIPNSVTYVIQAGELSAYSLTNVLKALLEDWRKVKVMCDVHQAASWLHEYGVTGIKLRKCVDLQLLYEDLVDANLAHLLMVHTEWTDGDDGLTASQHRPKQPEQQTQQQLGPGSGNPPYQKTLETENPLVLDGSYVSISAMLAYENQSTEEIRHEDYSKKRASKPTDRLPAFDSAALPAPPAGFSFGSPLRQAPSSSVSSSSSSSSAASESALWSLGFSGVSMPGTLRQNGATPDARGAITSAGFVFASGSGSSTTNAKPNLDTRGAITSAGFVFSSGASATIPTTSNSQSPFSNAASSSSSAPSSPFDRKARSERVKCPTFGAPTQSTKGVSTCTLSGVSSYVYLLHSELEKDPLAWSQSKISSTLVNLVADAAQLLPASMMSLMAKVETSVQLFSLTNLRWNLAAVSKGNRSIWFDSQTSNYQSKSLELLCKLHPDTANAQTIVPEVRLECELEPLLELLPEKFKLEILKIVDFEDKLVDICLDVGRSLHAYTTKKERFILGNELVTKDDVDFIVQRLGGEHKIGFDNRAGIDQQLHRVSVMRSKTNEIYGMTLRVGRALQNAAGVLLDLKLSQEHKRKSILLLGYPGSGKTTLIRDIARCVSETVENVCIIDTSNEIGGDRLVPHACIGFARRMMVKSLEQQASVMIECVQNHAVETLIVDEIGRKAEVDAAGTKAPGKGKVQAARGGNPIFDVIVELDNVDRGKCRIIWNTGEAVDSILAGQGYTFETRLLDFHTLGIHEFGESSSRSNL